MKKRDGLKNILGWIAVIIALILSVLWSYWGIIEFFHEGWHYSSVWELIFLFFVQYLLITLLFIGLPLLALKYKKVGLVSFIILGLFSIIFFSGASFQVTYILLAFPFLALGFLFYFGTPKNVLLAKILLVIVPILVIIIFGTPLLIRNLQRMDDGNYGERLIDCQGTNLVWAGRGEGFPNKGYNWTEAKNKCEHLSADGITLSSQIENIWRVPSIEELVKCQMIHNKNSKGVFDNITKKATYDQTPDKETPLWVPKSEVIYYWTSELNENTENRAYIVDYSGGVYERDIRFSPNYLSFRCVKDAQ